MSLVHFFQAEFSTPFIRHLDATQDPFNSHVRPLSACLSSSSLDAQLQTLLYLSDIITLFLQHELPDHLCRVGEARRCQGNAGQSKLLVLRANVSRLLMCQHGRHTVLYYYL